MRKFLAVGFAVVAIAGCEKEKEAEIPKITTTPPTQKEVIEEVEKSEDGPDCATFIAEVRQACVDRFARGLDVDCHGYVTQANLAVKQKSGELIDDPTGKADTRPAGDKMCAMYGLKLRKEVAGATAAGGGEHCAELGRRLDQRCFSVIGTKNYHITCSGPLIATKRMQKDPETMCEAQLAVFK